MITDTEAVCGLVACSALFLPLAFYVWKADRAAARAARRLSDVDGR